MERMNPESVMEYAINRIDVSQLDTDGRIALSQIAFAFYILTGEKSSHIIEKFGITQEDVDEYMASGVEVAQSEYPEDDQSFVRDIYQQGRQTEYSQPEPAQPQRNSNIITDYTDSDFKQEATRASRRGGDPFYIPQTREDYEGLPLVPRNRRNLFQDTGVQVESNDKVIDSQIKRPQYTFNRRPPVALMIDKKCRICRNQFSVDENEFRELGVEGGPYEVGYICAKCARKEITSGRGI